MASWSFKRTPSGIDISRLCLTIRGLSMDWSQKPKVNCSYMYKNRQVNKKREHF